MSLNSLLSHTITTYRNKPNGVGIQKSFVKNLFNTPALIQPLSAQYANLINETFGRSYNMFLPIDTDVEIGDKVVDQDGKEYRVKGSMKRNYGGVPHLTFILNEQVQATPDQ